MRSRRSTASPAAIFLSLLLPVIVNAQEPDSVETLVVTASRAPVPAREVGSSLTLLGADDLSARQTPALAEILRGLPGLAVSRSGVAGSTTQVRVRGAEGNHVLVLIDGIEANDPALGGEFNFAHLLAGDVDRVEIVRGPQSALWGSEALAGVISIQTRRGRPGLALSGFAEGGAFGTVRTGASLSGGGELHHFRISGSVLDSDGSNISRQGSEADGYDNTTLAMTAGWRPMPVLSVEFAGRHVEGSNEFDGTDFLTGLPADASLRTDFEQDYGRVESRLALFDGKWVHAAAVALTATQNDNFDAGLEMDSTGGRKVRAAYQTDLSLETPQWRQARHAVSLAVEYEHEEYEQRGIAGPFGDPNQDQSLNSRGLAAEYRLVFSDALSLTAGVRHDGNSDFADDTGWRLTAAQFLSRTGTRLRASLGTGSRNPTFIERFGFYSTSPTPFFGNPDLRPEQSRGWEIGADQALAGGRASVGLAWFDQDLSDEINGFVFDPLRGGFTAVNLDGRSRRNGLEVTANAVMGSALELAAAYAWLNATEPDPVTGDRVRELRRPRHNASLNLNYRFAADRANVNFNIALNGEQKDVYFPPPAYAAVPVTLDAFALATLAAAWKLNPVLTVFGRIENLFGADYEEVYGYSAPGIGAFAGVRIAPSD